MAWRPGLPAGPPELVAARRICALPARDGGYAHFGRLCPDHRPHQSAAIHAPARSIGYFDLFRRGRQRDLWTGDVGVHRWAEPAESARRRLEPGRSEERRVGPE